VSDSLQGSRLVHQERLQPTVAGLTKAGISVKGLRVLAVRGRTSGEWRTTPVNLLDYDDHQYLVAPWVSRRG
jgi:hypothetical protein